MAACPLSETCANCNILTALPPSCTGKTTAGRHDDMHCTDAMRTRASRHGKTNRPFYSIVVADSRAPRDTFKVKLGFYDPLLSETSKVVVDMQQVRRYISSGAILTVSVKRLLTCMIHGCCAK